MQLPKITEENKEILINKAINLDYYIKISQKDETSNIINKIGILSDEINNMKLILHKFMNDFIALKPLELNEKQKQAIERYKNYINWFEIQKIKYKNKIIAFIEKKPGELWEVIAVGNNEKELFMNIDEAIKKNLKIVDYKIHIQKFSDHSGFFKY
ncbi:MAG: hypothetical protein ACTSPY_06840 [Candidatus Helarchaeota archaeon]